MPAARLNISPLICVPLPMPAELKFIVPGLAFMNAISSFTVFGPRFGATTSKFGTLATCDTPAKSLIVSYGSFEYSVAFPACPVDTIIMV